MQIRAGDEGAFSSATAKLAADFTFRELDEGARKAFENFIM